MKEVYRSFEGKINLDNQFGYIIYDLGDFYQIEFVSIELADRNSSSVRIKKDILFPDDFKNLDRITELEMNIENGRANYGQYQYKGKWYGCDMIRKIQNKNRDGNWKKYIE